MRMSDWSSDVCSSDLRARLRQRELFLGQGDAVDGDVGEFCQRDRHAAPAAADVEHPLARRERELGRDMRLLRRLRLLQRHVLARPVGAAILQVAVEEEAGEGVADVVVMLAVRAAEATTVVRMDTRPYHVSPP